MLRYRFLIGAVALLPLVSLSSSATSENKQIIDELRLLNLKGDLMSGNIDQLAVGPIKNTTVYHINISLGEPSTYKRTILSRGEPRIAGTWNIYRDIPTGMGIKPNPVPGLTGIAEFKFGPKNELIINLQKGVSNGKTVLTLSKPNFQRTEFSNGGLLFVKQGMQTTYFKQVHNALKKMKQDTPTYELFQNLIGKLGTPEGVGIIKFVDESIEPLKGIGFVILTERAIIKKS